MIEPIEELVSKEQFENFVANYPRHLYKSHHYICTPTLVSYDDFSLGCWPRCSVAWTWINDQYPEIPIEEKYYIVTNHEELYAERGTDNA